MLWRIETAPRPDLPDAAGGRVARRLASELRLPVTDGRVVKVFVVDGVSAEEAARLIDLGVFHDPISQVATAWSESEGTPLADVLGVSFDWAIDVAFRPGVTDNEGRTATASLALALGLDKSRKARVFSGAQYLLSGALTAAQAGQAASGMLANDLIQRHEVKSRAEWTNSPGFAPRAAAVRATADSTVETVSLAGTDAELATLSREKVLALSVEEMRAIRDHYARPEVRAARASMGLSADPTDVELECLAQTWSEHCKHKIFNAEIDYVDEAAGRREVVDSLFKSCIRQATADVRAAKQADGKDGDYCLSVFTDNAGIIRFTEDWSVCVKVETHNSPSALDPYGGALTGIVGVNRDILGAGLGASLLCNTDVFCFASPFYGEKGEGELPPRLLHPRRVFEGVREGVEHGGNKSGVPTVNGAVVFHERFVGKPLVYCGTVGLMPATVAGKPSHEKMARPGDVIVMIGGRIGKDGIHGATFSSEELHEGSPATAVQIGDPITQRKAYDFLIRARDGGLYSAVTDNGAGGLSSSVGEMATMSGGCELDVAKAPLKYDGLRPWEILLSEAQERMTLAVPPEKLEAFMGLAEEMDVEATALGRFTDTGLFHVQYAGKSVACLDMDFLHDGAPRMRLKAAWTPPAVDSADYPAVPAVSGHAGLLTAMLGRLNICSKEFLIRQYDHEVQGGSAVKPLCGVKADGPSDAGVVRPVLGLDRGLVVACGICPKYSDLDAYWMMAGAIDEAVRNAVAAGGDPDYLAGCDNFCWCDPVESEKTPDGAYKLAQLVRANKALLDYCRAYGLPLVSGKDSMKNDYSGGGRKISIPPTVLFTVIGVMPDVNRAMTSDFKQPGDLVYVLGLTRSELGGSELADQLGLPVAKSGRVPQVDALAARDRYRKLHTAMAAGLVNACHDCSDGGLAVALAEMALGGRLGAKLDLAKAPAEPGLTPLELLYSESHSRMIVCVAPEMRAGFEAAMAGDAIGLLGTVEDGNFHLAISGQEIASLAPGELARAFKATLDW